MQLVARDEDDYIFLVQKLFKNDTFYDYHHDIIYKKFKSIGNKNYDIAVEWLNFVGKLFI